MIDRQRFTGLAPVAFAVLALYFFASWEVRALYFSNQNTYFLQGLRMAGVESLQRDWLSGTRSPHIVFSLTVAALQSLGRLTEGVHLLEVLLYVGLLWTFWALSNSRPRRDDGRSLSVRFLACGLFFAFLTERGIWSALFSWGGLADQYLFGGYLQPSEFGIAILVALALLSLDRARWAIVSLVVAAVFHASYLLPCGLLAALIAADAAFRRQWREAALLLTMFGVGVAPVVLYALTFGGDPATVAQANNLLARTVIPQHAWPAFWFSAASVKKLSVMGVGTWLAWRHLCRPVARAMTASLLLIVAGILFVYVSKNAFVGLLFPWRASVYLYPLSLFTLVIAAADTADGLARYVGRARMNSLATGGALLFGALLCVESIRELTIRHSRPAFPFADVVSKSTTPTDIIIVPPVDADLWNRFRLLTIRPTYADHKSHPYLATEVLEWKRRNEEVDELYRLPENERPRRCGDLGASYYVSTADASSSLPSERELSLMRCSR